MFFRRLLASRLSDVLWVGLSALTLSVSLFYVSYRIGIDLGFVFDKGMVTSVAGGEDAPASGLRVNDQIVRIGSVNYESARANRTIDVLRDLRSGERVFVEVLRDGETLVIPVQARRVLFLPPENVATCFATMLFWLMGTIAGIFLRPRDDRWLVLILCFYVTAMWLASGFVSAHQVSYARVVFHSLIWLFMPLSIHLHLILPTAPFRKYDKIILPSLYLGSLAFVLLDYLRIIDEAAYGLSMVLAILVSVTLLIYRLFTSSSPAIKLANRLMFLGVVLGVGPALVYVILEKYLFRDLSVAAWGGVTFFMAFMPIWPLTYIYAIYKHDLGTVRYRANRLIGGYGFLAIFLTSYVFVFASLATGDAFAENPFVLSVTVSLAFVAVVPYGRDRFQSWFDRYVFGIRYTPHEVVSAFAARIPSAFNRMILRDVITKEIMPTLLIKESALYYFGGEELEMIYEQEAPDTARGEGEEQLKELLAYVGRYLPFDTPIHPGYGWVRLVVPLLFQNEPVGIWLLGSRDPDDYYPQNDIDLLTNLANQIAPVIENVRLVEIAQQEVAENRRLHQQLLHSQKMEAIGSLSAGIAHDFNNLLSVILGNSYLLLEDYDEKSELGRFLGEIRDAGERASSLTRQLLTFSRQSAMEVKVLSLNGVIDDMMQMLSMLAGKQVEVKVRFDPDLAYVRLDPGQMGQVIVNLVVNARDAMSEGGQIAIETANIEHCSGGLFARVDMEPGPYVWLQVADTGTGLDPEIRSRIFEPFFTTKEAGKGTGLGLSMVYGIINQSGGQVFVESEPGEGTCFHIFLPAVSAAEAAAEAVPEIPRDEVLGGNETVLVVEDEESVRDVACMILRGQGYDVLEAEGGKRGLEIARRHDGSIDLLLTDVIMPQMKGPELAGRLLDRRPALRILYMSGYHDESDFEDHQKASGPELIQKPFTPQELSRRVREVLDSG